MMSVLIFCLLRLCVCFLISAHHRRGLTQHRHHQYHDSHLFRSIKEQVVKLHFGTECHTKQLFENGVAFYLSDILKSIIDRTNRLRE